MLLMLKARQQQLGRKLATATLGRKFEEAGVTRQSAGWYVNENGKLDQIR